MLPCNMGQARIHAMLARRGPPSTVGRTLAAGVTRRWFAKIEFWNRCGGSLADAAPALERHEFLFNNYVRPHASLT